MGRKKLKSGLAKWGMIIGISLLLALVVRYSLCESFRMPSAQMEATILCGDYLFADKTAYQVKIPFYSTPLAVKPAKRNDVVIYFIPGDSANLQNEPSVTISRCIALPGDTIRVESGDYFVNGKKIPPNPNRLMTYNYPAAYDARVKSAIDKLQIPLREPEDSKKRNKSCILSPYEIFLIREELHDAVEFELAEEDNLNYKLIVPEEHYWMLSDNAATSADSRHFGFISHDQLIGKAKMIWWSKNPGNDLFSGYRWKRLFKMIH